MGEERGSEGGEPTERRMDVDERRVGVRLLVGCERVGGCFGVRGLCPVQIEWFIRLLG